MVPPKTSLYQQHREKWRSCMRCLLCAKRRRVVLARGSIPCDVLFVGEAPGQSEDVMGIPFCGPAGHLLDSIAAMAQVQDLRLCFTNLVACIPKSPDGGKINEPPEEAIRACQPRLLEMLKLCQPRLIVCVGALADRHIPAWPAADFLSIVHPAGILRAPLAARPLAVQQAAIKLYDACQNLRKKERTR